MSALNLLQSGSRVRQSCIKQRLDDRAFLSIQKAVVKQLVMIRAGYPNVDRGGSSPIFSRDQMRPFNISFKPANLTRLRAHQKILVLPPLLITSRTVCSRILALMLVVTRAAAKFSLALPISSVTRLWAFLTTLNAKRQFMCGARQSKALSRTIQLVWVPSRSSERIAALFAWTQGGASNKRSLMIPIASAAAKNLPRIVMRGRKPSGAMNTLTLQWGAALAGPHVHSVPMATNEPGMARHYCLAAAALTWLGCHMHFSQGHAHSVNYAGVHNNCLRFVTCSSTGVSCPD